MDIRAERTWPWWSKLGDLRSTQTRIETLVNIHFGILIITLSQTSPWNTSRYKSQPRLESERFNLNVCVQWLLPAKTRHLVAAFGYYRFSQNNYVSTLMLRLCAGLPYTRPLIPTITILYCIKVLYYFKIVFVLVCISIYFVFTLDWNNCCRCSTNNWPADGDPTPF